MKILMVLPFWSSALDCLRVVNAAMVSRFSVLVAWLQVVHSTHEASCFM